MSLKLWDDFTRMEEERVRKSLLVVSLSWHTEAHRSRTSSSSSCSLAEIHLNINNKKKLLMEWRKVKERDGRLSLRTCKWASDESFSRWASIKSALTEFSWGNARFDRFQGSCLMSWEVKMQARHGGKWFSLSRSWRCLLYPQLHIFSHDSAHVENIKANGEEKYFLPFSLGKCLCC